MVARIIALLSLLLALATADNPANPFAAAQTRARKRFGGGAVGVGTGSGGAAPEAGKSYLHMRTDLNQVRLDRLIAAVDRAEADFKDANDHHDDHEVDHLEERIASLTGSTCKRRQFQCGGLTPQCISNMLVCDGSADCDNGHDEDSDVCVNLITEGSSWSWSADWGTCVSSDAHSGKFLVTSVDRPAIFPSHVKLDLTVTTDDDSKDRDTYDGVLSTKGRWSFGARKLIIFPGTAGFPATVCHFEKGSDDHCEGPLVNVNTWEKCGTITATRHN